MELDQILGDKNDFSDGEIEEKSPTASIFNVKNKQRYAKKETRKCYNCGITGHLKATCWRKGNSSQQNNRQQSNIRKKYNNQGRNNQNRRPNNLPGNGGKVNLLDTTDLQGLDLNSSSLQPEKELLL